MQKNLKKYGWLFLLPTAVAFLFAFAAPFVLGVGLSFTRFRTVTDAAWVGLQNYVQAFTADSGFLHALWFTALQNVPDDLLEAAAIDGASRTQTLFRIKLPLVMPAVTICTFLTLTNTFKMFDQNLALTGGAPEQKTELLALNIYNTFYGRSGWQGVGQAKAVVFFIIVALLAFLQLRVTGQREAHGV